MGCDKRKQRCLFVELVEGQHVSRHAAGEQCDSKTIEGEKRTSCSTTYRTVTELQQGWCGEG